MKPETAVEVVNQIRKWLKDGATIKARSKDDPILEEQADGVIYGGMEITFPTYSEKDNPGFTWCKGSGSIEIRDVSGSADIEPTEPHPSGIRY